MLLTDAHLSTNMVSPMLRTFDLETSDTAWKPDLGRPVAWAGLRRPTAARLLACALGGLWLACTPAQAALLVTSEFHDLPDVVLGQDLWRASYELQGMDFLTGQGFTIYFDHARFADLAGPFPPLNAGWDLLLIQPDTALPDDGFLDGLALVDIPSVAEPFLVEFTWLGSGRPGVQAVETYDTRGGFTATAAPPTQVIPEPGSGAWLSAVAVLGGAVWLRAGRRWRRTNCG